MQKREPWTNRNGFTLIELLTVIAIIAILVGLLFPAISSALKKAEATQAKTDIKAIETAIKAYYTEYGKYPIPNAHQGQHFVSGNSTNDIYYGNGTGGCNGDGIINGLVPQQYDIIDTLRAISTSGHQNFNDALNLRKIVFLDAPSRKGAIDSNGYFRDPWGNLYLIKPDTDYDNIVSYYSFTNSTVAIVSYGPDGSTTPPCGQCDPKTSGCNDITNLQ